MYKKFLRRIILVIVFSFPMGYFLMAGDKYFPRIKIVGIEMDKMTWLIAGGILVLLCVLFDKFLEKMVKCK